METVRWIIMDLWRLILAAAEGGRGVSADLVETITEGVERHRNHVIRVLRWYVFFVLLLGGITACVSVGGLGLSYFAALIGWSTLSDLSMVCFGIITAVLVMPLIILLRAIPNIFAAFNYVREGVTETSREIALFLGRLQRNELAPEDAPPGSARAAVAERHRLWVRFTEPPVIMSLAVLLMYFGFFASGMGAAPLLIAGEIMLALVVGMCAFLVGRRTPTWVFTAVMVVAIIGMVGTFTVRALSYRFGPLMPEPEVSVPVARADRVDVFNPNIYSLRVRVKGANGARTQIFDLRPGERRRVSVSSGGRLRLAADYPDLLGFGWSVLIDPANAEYDDLLNNQDDQGLVIGPGEVSQFGFYDHRPRMIIKKPIGIGR